MEIHHYPDDGIVRIDFLPDDGGPDDYGHEVAPGIVAHYRRAEGRADSLTAIEIMGDNRGRDLSDVRITSYDAAGNAVYPRQFAELVTKLMEAQRVSVIESSTEGGGIPVESPLLGGREKQKR